MRVLSIATRQSLIQGDWRQLPETNPEYCSKAKEFRELYFPLLLHWCDPVIRECRLRVDDAQEPTCRECGKAHPPINPGADHVALIDSVLAAVLVRLRSPTFRYDHTKGFRDYLNKVLQTKAIRYWLEHQPNRFKAWMGQHSLDYTELFGLVIQLINTGMEWPQIIQELAGDFRAWLVAAGCLNGSDIDLILSRVLMTLQREAQRGNASSDSTDDVNEVKGRMRRVLRRSIEDLHQVNTVHLDEFTLSCRDVADSFVADDGSFDRLSLLTIGSVASGIPENHQLYWLGEVLGLTGIQIAMLLEKPVETPDQLKRSVNTIHKALQRNFDNLMRYTSSIEEEANRWKAALRKLQDVADDVGTKVQCEQTLRDFSTDFGQWAIKLTPAERATWLAIGYCFAQRPETRSIVVAKQLGCSSLAVAQWLELPIASEEERNASTAKVDHVFAGSQNEIQVQSQMFMKVIQFADEQTIEDASCADLTANLVVD